MQKTGILQLLVRQHRVTYVLLQTLLKLRPSCTAVLLTLLQESLSNILLGVSFPRFLFRPSFLSVLPSRIVPGTRLVSGFLHFCSQSPDLKSHFRAAALQAMPRFAASKTFARHAIGRNFDALVYDKFTSSKFVTSVNID
jgi:hypothetical protein